MKYWSLDAAAGLIRQWARISSSLIGRTAVTFMSMRTLSGFRPRSASLIVSTALCAALVCAAVSVAWPTTQVRQYQTIATTNRIAAMMSAVAFLLNLVGFVILNLIIDCRSASGKPRWFEMSKMVELKGVEPLTSAMRMQRSSQLSYSPRRGDRDWSIVPGLGLGVNALGAGPSCRQPAWGRRWV